MDLKEKDSVSQSGAAIPETRLAKSPEAYQDPENHLFRKTYRSLTAGEASLMDTLKDKANEIHTLIQSIEAGGREISLAVTHLEQSIMWAVKAITR